LLHGQGKKGKNEVISVSKNHNIQSGHPKQIWLTQMAKSSLFVLLKKELFEIKNNPNIKNRARVE
jgi:hypothetical protein